GRTHLALPLAGSKIFGGGTSHAWGSCRRLRTRCVHPADTRVGLRYQVRLPSGMPLLDEPVRGGLQERIVSVWSHYASKQRLPDEGRKPRGRNRWTSMLSGDHENRS